MSGYDNNIKGDLDRFLTTNPDLERRSWVSCTACGYLFEPEDCEYLKDDEDEGVCCVCWKAGERPEDYDGEDGAP